LRGAVRRAGLYATELQLLIALAALYAVFAVARPSTFATWTNADNMARVGAILAVIAIGQAFALIIGGFDISVAANAGFVSVVIALMTNNHGGLGVGIPVGLGVALLIGLVNGFFVAQLRVNPFVVTLGMLTFLLGLGNQVADGASVAVLTPGFRWFGANHWGPIPSSVCIAAIVLALAWFVLGRSRLGLYIYAIGGSRDTARLAGAPAVRFEILAYGICGLLAGVGGMLLASQTTVGQAELGASYEVRSIAAAVIGGAAIGGGVGRLSGVVLGAALLTVLQTGLDISNVNEYIQRTITGLVLIAAVFVSQLRAGSLRNVVRLLGLARPVRVLPRRGVA
jgi:ribose/xylose/arabinose/galactoside ABC-type transport system permease subunit